jgi:hypothetical protein
VAITLSVLALGLSGLGVWYTHRSVSVAEGSLEVASKALEMQRLSLRPTLELGREVSAPFTLKITNKGLGPARVRWSALFIDDVRQTGWIDSMKFLGLEEGRIGGLTQLGQTHVLQPGEEQVILRIEDKPGHIAFNSAYNQSRVVLKYCYCSLYGDCWMTIWHYQNKDEEELVDECPRDNFVFKTP